MTEIRQEQIAGGLDGWVAANETWTYASADNPTYTFTISGDLTDKYSAGMRVKWTQTTVRYGIITKVAYSSPNTTITLYGGTDYDLDNATISSPYYSMVKAPQGFPLDSDKWSVTGGANNVTQTSPSSGTTYNVGGSIDVPVGVWDIIVNANLSMGNFNTSSAYIYTEYGIGTTTSALNIYDFVNRIYIAGGSFNRNEFSFSINYHCNLSTKDTYYFNADLTFAGSASSLGMSHRTCRAVCAYL